MAVGVGIRTPDQVSPEALREIHHSDKVFYLVADPVAEAWVRKTNASAESLANEYHAGEPRRPAYARMVERILASVREGGRVCAVFYGHPGVFVSPSHEAIRQAREEGYPARMLPAISAEDCLYADLGVDPARSGCQSYEATDFLIHDRRFDPTSSLILWQVGVVGSVRTGAVSRVRGGPALKILTTRLLESYPASHEIILYEASPYAVADPTISRLPLRSLPVSRVAPVSTLYIPPLPSNLSDSMTRRLKLRREEFG